MRGVAASGEVPANKSISSRSDVRLLVLCCESVTASMAVQSLLTELVLRALPDEEQTLYWHCSSTRARAASNSLSSGFALPREWLTISSLLKLKDTCEVRRFSNESFKRFSTCARVQGLCCTASTF